MPIHSTRIEITTNGFSDVHDLTSQAKEFLDACNVGDGLMTVFVPGSTASITTIEFEFGAIADLKRAIERLAPQDIYYDHNVRWGDDNGFSHVRAAMLGPSVCVPISKGQLQLGTWQQIVLVDFDNRQRQREIIFQIVGE